MLGGMLEDGSAVARLVQTHPRLPQRFEAPLAEEPARAHHLGGDGREIAPLQDRQGQRLFGG
eukprot:2479036-Lingulodinium_polyedra.AAC.1